MQIFKRLNLTHTPMFLAALFAVARIWKQFRCSSTDEWIKKLWYIYTMEYLVQFSSVTQSCPTLCDPMNHSMPGLPVHHQLPEFTQTHVHQVVMPSSHLILCHPLLLLPPVPPSIRVFSNESTLCMRWPKYWSFSFSIIPSKEHPGLISFRMDWLDLLAVQGTLKSLLQHHSSKASILWRSAFFTVQLSHKKECIWLSSNKMGGPRACYTQWSKSERERQIFYINT